MIAFTPTGPLLGFTSASSAPTSVQAISLDGVQDQQVRIVNVDASNDAVIGWGASDTIAKANSGALASNCNCVYVLRNSSVVVTVPPASFFSGIAVANTAVIKVQAGYGKM